MANQARLIMKSLPILILATSLICGSGCKSQQGYIAVLDLDFRKPAQIEACAREAEAPYKNWIMPYATQEIKKEEIKKESLSVTWWETILNAISKLECRITLFQMRWGGEKQVDNK